MLILFIPVIIKKYTKKEFYKSILLSIISVVVYFIVIILFETYYLEYSKNFTIKNWKENPSLRVYLGASKNKEGFYEKFGFNKRIDADLGYGMILKDNNL